ncbi:MAG: spermidine synthase [Candidatus Kerfeldbacteria bacterium]
MNKFNKIWLVVTLLINGAAVMVLEILGTRILSPFYGSTIFVWSSLISTALAFLALGYWLGGKAVDRLHDKEFDLKIFKVKKITDLFVSILFSAGIIFLIIPKLDSIILIWTDSFGIRFGPLVASVIMFSIPLFLLGTISPIAIRYQTKDIGTVGMQSGRIFAIATVGSLVGALASGFFLIPNFSLSVIFSTTGALLIILALGWLFAKRGGFTSIITIVLLIIIQFLLPSHVVSQPAQAKIIYKEQSYFGDIKLYELRAVNQNIRCLLIDTSSQSCWNYDINSSAWPYTRYFRGAINAFPEDQKLDILILGLGGGAVVKELSDTTHNVDIVEINPRIIELSTEFFDLPTTDNFTYIVQDARYYVRHTDKKYDLIMIDIVIGSEPSIHMVTEEFFTEGKSILKPNGILSTNAMGWIKSEDQQPIVYNTLASVFSMVKFSVSNPDGYGSIVYFASDREFVEQDFRGMIPNFFGRELLENHFTLSELPIFTDDYNPSYTLDIPTIVYGRNVTLEDFGYEFYLFEPNNEI